MSKPVHGNLISPQQAIIKTTELIELSLKNR